MPSAEETTYLIEVVPDAGISQDFTSRDVDALVSRIKENLRLKSRSSLARKMRRSPYTLPISRSSHLTSHLNDDAYFQALLRKGALIKEAVRRLRTCPEDSSEENKRQTTSTSATSTTLDSMDDEDEEDEEVVRRQRRQGSSESEDDFFFRRKQFYYDSEDEPLPPVFQPLEL